MGTKIQPVFYTTKETIGYTDSLGTDIKTNIGNDSDLLLDHPAIYIHVWRSKNDYMNGTYSIYVGETNDIIQRTKEHWNAAKVPKAKRTKGNWQYHMLEDVDDKGKQVVPTVYFFGHEKFHKSLTLDIENRLIDYCYAMETTHVYNGRTNPQGYYSGDENLDDIFSMIWRILRKDNPDLFRSETSIQKSAIYKSSPNHKLTEDQKEARDLIIDRVVDAVINDKRGQLVFVEGEAGTGKTVLTNCTFYDILASELLNSLDVKAYMLVNHEEQQIVYKNIARKLGYKEDIVQYPTNFLKKHSILDKASNKYVPDETSIVDIVFVDEAHLLWHQKTQAYDKKFPGPQLNEILKRARVTIIMYDENQVLHRRQISEMHYMEGMRTLAKEQGPNTKAGKNNYIELKNQLRMNCSIDTMSWIDQLTKEQTIAPLTINSKGMDSKGYEIRFFDNPESMHQAIIQKASNSDTELSRIIATLDWEYKNSLIPIFSRYWEIRIDSWRIPWNEEIFHRDLEGTLNKREIKRFKLLDWAEKGYSMYEAGTTYTIQGFDLSFSGVIIGPSVKYDPVKKKVIFDESFRTQMDMKGNRTMEDGSVINVTETISKNELRVLMTRGTKGLYIYACDDNLRKALNESLKIRS